MKVADAIEVEGFVEGRRDGRGSVKVHGGVVVRLATVRAQNEGEVSLTLAQARKMAKAINAAIASAERMLGPTPGES